MVCVKNSRKEISLGNIWKDDLFDRKTVANDFSKIITSIKQSFVVSIDAPYGNGKSFFLERWQKELDKDGNITVFFNAWKSDFVKNPLVPFMYSFLSQLEEQKHIKKKQTEDIKKALVSIGKNIINTGTGGIINPQEILNEQRYENFGLSSTSLDEYNEIISNIRKFKEKIIKLINDIKDSERNIYIFIDELERCRPTFAIELLESIKHLFDIEGLVFILGIDRSQLKCTISSIYGADMDGEGYLRRFIDLELNLPEPDRNKFINMLCEQFNIKHKESGLAGTWTSGYDVFNDYFVIFSNAYNMSLREIEQCYTEFNIITKTIPDDVLLSSLLALLLVIKYKNFTLYNKLGREYNDANKVIDIITKEVKSLIKTNEESSSSIDRRWNHLLAIIIACFEKDLDNKIEIITDDINQGHGDKYKTEEKKRLLLGARKILVTLHDDYGLYSGMNIFEFVKRKLSYTSLK